jgi:hypothetical protein
VGLLGLAFRKDPTMTAPDKLNYLRDNADGAGASIYQQSQQVTENILEAAREGFIRIMQLRPTRRSSFVIRRKASLTGAPNASMDVINWCWWFYANAWKRKMVLRTRMKSSIANLPWRTASLSAGCGESRPMQGLFLCREYHPKPKGEDFWDEIPFTFVGAQNNDPSIDESPLAALVRN